MSVYFRAVTHGTPTDMFDIVIPTGIGDMRNALIVRAASGLVAVGGGPGHSK